MISDENRRGQLISILRRRCRQPGVQRLDLGGVLFHDLGQERN